MGQRRQEPIQAEEKALALDFLDKATDLKRGSVKTMQAALEPAERRQAQGKERTTLHRTFARARMEKGLERAADHLRRITTHVRGLHRRIMPSNLSENQPGSYT